MGSPAGRAVSSEPGLLVQHRGHPGRRAGPDGCARVGGPGAGGGHPRRGPPPVRRTAHADGQHSGRDQQIAGKPVRQGCGHYGGAGPHLQRVSVGDPHGQAQAHRGPDGDQAGQERRRGALQGPDHGSLPVHGSDGRYGAGRSLPGLHPCPAGGRVPEGHRHTVSALGAADGFLPRHLLFRPQKRTYDSHAGGERRQGDLQYHQSHPGERAAPGAARSDVRL